MLVSVRSKDRLSTSVSSTNFTVQIPATNTRQISNLKLMQLTYPNTIYNITTSDTFLLSDINVTNSVISIASGSYTTSTFITAVQNAMNAVSMNYVITFDSTTYKFTITNVAHVYTLTFSDNAMARCFGFPVGASGTADGTLISTNIANFTIDTRLYIIVSNLATPGFTTSQSGSINYSFSIANIVPFGSWNLFTEGDINPFLQNIAFAPQLVSKLDIRVVNGDGEVVDFQGLDWEMLLYGT